LQKYRNTSSACVASPNDSILRCCSEKNTVSQPNDTVHSKSTFYAGARNTFLRCQIAATLVGAAFAKSYLKQKSLQPKRFVMKKASFYLFAILALFTIITSCKKDSSDKKTTPQNIAGVYKITGLHAKAANTDKIDIYDQLTECQKGDTWGFQEDGTFLFGGAATSNCQDGDFSGTWSLNGKTFTVTSDQSTTAYQLESFDGHALVVSTSGTLNNEPATYYVTFTKQ